MGLKGTQTEKNLLKAFAGESQARNRYTYFAGQARKEGLIQIADVFEETASQEKEHAKRFFSFLQGGDVEITACYPAGIIGTTEQNLKAAADGENFEWGTLYPDFSSVAKNEGFDDVAKVFELISIAEKYHARRYLGFLENVKSGKVFKKDKKVVWRCRNCGFTSEGEDAMKVCPACAHPQGYFELSVDTW
jgi:rubrerythrin